jgi:beta-phosphoglucomutase
MINFMKLQAVIWDMDGVVVDSEPAHLQAKRVIFEKFKLRYSEERIHRVYGMTDRQVIQFVADEQLPEDVISRMVREKDIVFQQLIGKQAAYLPGVQKWMELFRQNGISQALASSSSEISINLILNKLDAAQYFNEVISGEALPSKPDPFIFLKAAEHLGVIPLNCLVFEDAVAGVQAAKAAGMKCVAVTTTNPAEKLTDADLVLNNLGEMMTDHILGLFSR